ncbi:MAG: MaoC/PaaZ C-terminal domain-containing protein, partial [Crocinitomicaceae bacterium]
YHEELIKSHQAKDIVENTVSTPVEDNAVKQQQWPDDDDDITDVSVNNDSGGVLNSFNNTSLVESTSVIESNISIVTPDDKEAREYVVNAASMHGRILVLNKNCAKESTGHGSPMPLLTHGGPGRAGGGEEMGGKRGVLHYMQRTAIQGHPTTITEITQQFQVGAAMPEANPHVFRQHFEDLIVGDTVFTHKHTVTEADIVNFANVSGDNFYAHMDATSLEETIFERRVAHGYFLLSKAAGLFVDPKKGPVLLNYGIDECRFTKPVYPGATIGVRFTVKEKIDQEKRSEEDIAKGIVKFLVDIYDETGETVGIATILTMVKKRDQSA